MTRRWSFAIGIAAVLAGCSSAGAPISEHRGAGDGTDFSGAPSTSGGGTSGSGISPGTLTAGAWDDNRNFDWFSSFRSDVYAEGDPALPPFTDDEHAAAHARFGDERAAHSTLDIALVIDTTGSMGDEIQYLQTELADIATRAQTSHPAARTRWALILYRDDGDEYVVRTFDFDSDVERFRTNLAAQRADGGGDYPEAAHAGLLAMTNLAWRGGADTARVAFWVADAPHHAERATDLAMAVRSASDLDVHVYPVASSGVDRLTELTMRASAQLTGGRYLFLTDDSGVGGSHLEPSIPCYFVTRLNDAMLRMIDIEMSGVYREPASDEILRTGGDPSDGACTLDSGEVVRIF